ncbi:MAG: DMT family transporter [Spirochaetota bacterium]
MNHSAPNSDPPHGSAPAEAPAGGFGPYLILAAAFLWGTSGTAQALAPAGSTPLVIGSIRVGLGGIVLVLGAGIRGDFAGARRFLRPIFLLTGLLQALFNFSYFTALSLTGVAVGTMVAIGSAPIFAGLLGITFNGERVGVRWYAGTVAALVGLVLLIGGEGSVHVDLFGVLFALCAGFSYSFFTFLSGRLVREFAPDAVIGVSFMIATAMLSPFFLIVPLGWIASSAGIGTMLYMGLISSGVAYMLYGRGLKTVLVSNVGILTLAEPLTASVLGIVFLREPMTSTTLAGIALIFFAQVLIVRRRPRAGARVRASRPTVS